MADRPAPPARAILATSLLIAEAIGMPDETAPMPLDILVADDPVRTGYEQAGGYRELLSIALGIVAELQRTIERQRATIRMMREELRRLSEGRAA